MAKAKKKAAKKTARKAPASKKDLTRIDPGPRMSDARAVRCASRPLRFSPKLTWS
jgi:hypothetical protein